MPERCRESTLHKSVYPSGSATCKRRNEENSALLREEAHIWISTFHSACVRILRREKKIGYTKILSMMISSVVGDQGMFEELNVNEILFLQGNSNKINNRNKPKPSGLCR